MRVVIKRKVFHGGEANCMEDTRHRNAYNEIITCVK